MTEHKCVVQVGDKKDDNICNREANHSYKSKIQLEDGRLVEERLYVCDRHTQVFEEFLNDQGNYQ